MAGVTLDAGPLILAERRDRAIWEWLRVARLDRVRLVVPAPALAQAWRGPTSAPLASLLRGATVEPMDEVIARLVGELCARSGTSNVVDAAVVICAALARTDILTTDRRDIERLASLTPGVGAIHFM